jgi:hypothetical protein
MSWQQPQDPRQPQGQTPQWGEPQQQAPQYTGGPQQQYSAPPQQQQYPGAPQQQQYPGAPQQQQYLGAPQPLQGGAPTPFYTPHPYEKKRTSSNTRRIVSLVILIVVAGGYWAYDHFSGNVSAVSLTVGECFNGGSVGDQDLSTVNSVPCTQAHSAQVIGIEQMTDSSFPDSADLQTEAESDCKPFFTALPTSLPSGAQPAFIVPALDAFSSGDKSIECLVQYTSQDLTTSYVTN